MGTKEYKNIYTYEKDRIKTASHNTNDNTPDVTYTFDYDALGNSTTVKVGSLPLSTNVYSDSGDKLLRRVEYGNGGKGHYTYDAFKRTTGIRYDDATGPRFVYEYGVNGEVGNARDTELNREARVSYGATDFLRISRPDQETIDKMSPEEKEWLRHFCLQVEFHPVGAAADVYKPGGQADFNEEWVGWQYACAAVVTPEAYGHL